MSVLDWLLIAFIAFCIVIAVRSLIKQKKSGKCCGGCQGCSFSGNCSKKNASKPEKQHL